MKLIPDDSIEIYHNRKRSPSRRINKRFSLKRGLTDEDVGSAKKVRALVRKSNDTVAKLKNFNGSFLTRYFIYIF